MRSILSTIWILLIWHPLAIAQITDKPTKAPPAVSAQTDKTNKTDSRQQNCFTFHTRLVGRSFFFGKGDTIYILANSGARSERRSSVALYVHRVLKLDYKKNNLSVVPNTILSLPAGSFFIPSSDPPKFYSAVSFTPQSRGCQYGMAQIFLSYTEKYKRQKIVAYKREVSLFESLPSTRLFDLSANKMLDIDVYYSQFRRLNNNIPKDEIPVYAEPNTGIIYTLKTQKDNTAKLRRLDRKDSSLSLGVGEKILRQGRFFGVGIIHADLNRLEILEFPEWSSITDKRRRYLIQVPASYPLSHAEIAIDFTNKTIALGGAIEMTKRKWRKVFFYNYKQGKLIHTFEYEKGLIPKSMNVHPAGGYIAMDMVRENNHRGIYLALYDIEKQTMRKLSMRPRKK